MCIRDRNYWGYAPLAFFAPEPSYASSPHPTAAAREFRDLVKALHRAGIEVFLDVVYNHTAEGPLDGPTHCLRGFGAGTYYIIRDDGSYALTVLPQPE